MTRGMMWLAIGAGLLATPAAAQVERGGVGLRLGVGTDISLGVAGGVEVNYARPRGTGAFEVGLTVFAGRSSEDSESSCCTYHETTELLVGAVLANYLFGYAAGGPYFVAGVGVGAINVYWKEESPDDVSLGQPLPGGGTFQDEEATAGGTILNLGVGTHVSQAVDLRVQAPTFILVSEGPGEAASVVPTLTVSVGFRF